MTALWEQCLRSLEHELPAQQYNTWIRPLLASESSQQLVLSAPNRFVRDWVRDKYLERIEQILSELNGGRITPVDLVVGESQPMFRPSGSPSAGLSTASAPISPPTSSFAETRVRREDQEQPERQQELPIVESLQAGARPHVEREVQVEGGLKHRSFLNASFTFKSFVEGKSNQLAHAAAQQVAENAGGSYNPLFIYGGVGLGKTHLMHAVGNHLQGMNPNAKVLYVHSERFVQDMVKALQLNAINEFKRFYRSLDALLIDDIQFFAGKE